MSLHKQGKADKTARHGWDEEGREGAAHGVVEGEPLVDAFGLIIGHEEDGAERDRY